MRSPPKPPFSTRLPPCNAAAMYIQDEHRQLALLTDRAQGELAAAGAQPLACRSTSLACLQAPAPCLPCLPAGGASLRSGQMEVMVHRRTLEGQLVRDRCVHASCCTVHPFQCCCTMFCRAADDFRGVAEPLNETACGCTECDCPGEWVAHAPCIPNSLLPQLH